MGGLELATSADRRASGVASRLMRSCHTQTMADGLDDSTTSDACSSAMT